MTETVACVHHWIIESPHGNVKVKGICKNCDEEKEWFASGDTEWLTRDTNTKRPISSLKDPGKLTNEQSVVAETRPRFWSE